MIWIFLLVGSAWWVHIHGVPAWVRRIRLPPVSSRSPRYQPPPPGYINWFHVALLTLLGIVILFRGIAWYLERSRVAIPLAVAAQPTPPPPIPALPSSLNELLARFPRDGAAFEGNLPFDVADTLDALITRFNESPEKVRDALMPAIYSSNDATRRKVLTAFRSKQWRWVPSPLLAEAAGKGPRQHQALEAALALGAWRTSPNLVIVASRNPTNSALVQEELRLHTDAASARFLALTWVEGADYEFGRLANEREKLSHDVSAALLELSLIHISEPTRPY